MTLDKLSISDGDVLSLEVTDNNEIVYKNKNTYFIFPLTYHLYSEELSLGIYLLPQSADPFQK